MRKRKFTLKNVDPTTAERIGQELPPDWEMDKAFEASFAKYEARRRHRAAPLEPPAEIVMTQASESRERGGFWSRYGAVACAAAMLVLVGTLVPEGLRLPVRSPGAESSDPIAEVETSASEPDLTAELPADAEHTHPDAQPVPPEDDVPDAPPEAPAVPAVPPPVVPTEAPVVPTEVVEVPTEAPVVTIDKQADVFRVETDTFQYQCQHNDKYGYVLRSDLLRVNLTNTYEEAADYINNYMIVAFAEWDEEEVYFAVPCTDSYLGSMFLFSQEVLEQAGITQELVPGDLLELTGAYSSGVLRELEVYEYESYEDPEQMVEVEVPHLRYTRTLTYLGNGVDLFGDTFQLVIDHEMESFQTSIKGGQRYFHKHVIADHNSKGGDSLQDTTDPTDVTAVESAGELTE